MIIMAAIICMMPPTASNIGAQFDCISPSLWAHDQGCLIMAKQELVVYLGAFLGPVIAFGLHCYVRFGKYQRSRYPRNGEDWYVTPAWLRLPLFVLYGISALYLFASCIDFAWDYDIIPWLVSLSGPLSLVLTLILCLFEYDDTRPRNLQRKRSTQAIAFLLGITLAVVFYKAIVSMLN